MSTATSAAVVWGAFEKAPRRSELITSACVGCRLPCSLPSTLEAAQQLDAKDREVRSHVLAVRLHCTSHCSETQHPGVGDQVAGAHG